MFLLTGILLFIIFTETELNNDIIDTFMTGAILREVLKLPY